LRAKSQSLDVTKELKSLASTVGDFISYWGFRSIHGQLWTLIWLSQDAMTGAQLGRALGVSKALVSSALAELEGYGLVRATASEDARAKCYDANEDVYSVIKGVLRDREMRLMSRAEGEVTYLKRRLLTDSALHAKVAPKRLQTLAEMVNAGNSALALLTSSAGLEVMFSDKEP